MSGSGFKDWSTGDLVTADDFDGYVQKQVIAHFADATARDAAITSPEEGMHAYLADSDVVTAYSGSAWVTVGRLVTAAGSLLVGSTSGLTELVKGSSLQSLRVNSGATGLEWADPGSGGLSLVGYDSTEASTTSASMTDVVTVSGLSVAATQPLLVIAGVRKASTTTSCSVGLKVNSTVIGEAAFGSFGAVVGMLVAFVGPSVGGNGGSTIGWASSTDSATSNRFGPAAARPNATVTSVSIRAKNSDGTTSVYVDEVFVYALDYS